MLTLISTPSNLDLFSS